MERGAPRLANPPPSVRRVQEWSIGIYLGEGPWDLRRAPIDVNPVLTRHAVSDVRAHFVADPFMLNVRGTWHMFFEVMDAQTGRGLIGLATSGDGLRWRYDSIVLREPFHLSYPYVFEWANEYFMVPESHQAGAVRLYRAERFPWDWKLVGHLIEGPCLLDPSLFHANGRWWMFVETNGAFRFDTLRLYSAGALDGGWHEHPVSPIVAGNPHIARPAGRVMVHDARIVRVAQDCAPRYGLSVSAFEILELTVDTYREQRLTSEPILAGCGSGWNCGGMHHLDAHALADDSWIACVDGWVDVDPEPAYRNQICLAYI